MAAREPPLAAPADLTGRARRFYFGGIGPRADHPGAQSHGDYFDRHWRKRGRKPELDHPDERRGYELARRDYIAACCAYRKNRQQIDRAVEAAHEYARLRQEAGHQGWGVVPIAWMRAHGVPVQTRTSPSPSPVQARARGRRRRQPSSGRDPPEDPDPEPPGGLDRDVGDLHHVAGVLDAYVSQLRRRAA
jgi:hypothetical protein